jgi:hypothetical protein
MRSAMALITMALASALLEELNRALVFFGRRARFERAQVSAFARARIFLARV